MPQLSLLSSLHSTISRLIDAYALSPLSIPSQIAGIDECKQIYLYARYPASSILGQMTLYPPREEFLQFEQPFSPKVGHILDLEKVVKRSGLIYGGIQKLNPISYQTIKLFLPDFYPSRQKHYIIPADADISFLQE